MVVVIVGVLSMVSYVAVQKAQTRALNEKMLDDLIAIANSLEDYRRDHNGEFPMPKTEEEVVDPEDASGNQNINCYYSDATYAHDCSLAAFRQGMIDNDLLSKRYLREVPTDPHTGSRYVYGVTSDGKYFQVAGLYEADDGVFEARTVENLAKGFELPSIVRAFDGANFVVDKGTYLPYSADHLVLSARLDNISGEVEVVGKSLDEILYEGDEIRVPQGGNVDIYFSDGSITNLGSGISNSELVLKDMKVSKNDKTGTVTSILLKLKAGKIWSKVVRLASESEFRVETNSAIAGVRGTEFGIDDTDEVIVKAGDVWKDLKADISLTGVTDAPVAQIFARHKPERPPELPADTPYVAITEDITKFEQYYEDIQLNTNMRPHILAINGSAGTIRIRNINYFVEKVNEKLAERGLPSDRTVKVSHIVAYTLVSTTPLELPLTELPAHFAISDDISTETSNFHTLTFSAGQMGTLTTEKPHLLLRFELREVVGTVSAVCVEPGMYWDSVAKECLGLKEHSAFSVVPTQINATTSVNQYDLYPELFEGRPHLRFVGPFNISLVGDVTDPPVGFNLGVDNYEGAVSSYAVAVVTTDPETMTCIPSVDSGGIGTIEISKGTCNLSAVAELDNGDILEEFVTIEALLPTGSLDLRPPRLITESGVKKVQFRWDVQNVPPHSFLLMVNPVSGTGGVPPDSSAISGGAYSIGTDAGYLRYGTTYKWDLMMLEDPCSSSPCPVLQQAETTFQFSEPSLVDFNISVDDTAPYTAPAPYVAPYVTREGAVRIFLDAFNPPLVSPDHTFAWNAEGLVFDTTVPRRPSATVITSAGNVQDFRIFLEVHDSAGVLVGQKSKTVVIDRPLDVIVTEIAFVHANYTPFGAGEMLPMWLGETIVLNDPAQVPLIVTNTSEGIPDAGSPIILNSACTFSITTSPAVGSYGSSTYSADGVGIDTIECTLAATSMPSGFQVDAGRLLPAELQIEVTEPVPTLIIAGPNSILEDNPQQYAANYDDNGDGLGIVDVAANPACTWGIGVNGTIIGGLLVPNAGYTGSITISCDYDHDGDGGTGSPTPPINGMMMVTVESLPAGPFIAITGQTPIPANSVEIPYQADYDPGDGSAITTVTSDCSWSLTGAGALGTIAPDGKYTGPVGVGDKDVTLICTYDNGSQDVVGDMTVTIEPLAGPVLTGIAINGDTNLTVGTLHNYTVDAFYSDAPAVAVGINVNDCAGWKFTANDGIITDLSIPPNSPGQFTPEADRAGKIGMINCTYDGKTGTLVIDSISLPPTLVLNSQSSTFYSVGYNASVTFQDGRLEAGTYNYNLVTPTGRNDNTDNALALNQGPGVYIYELEEVTGGVKTVVDTITFTVCGYNAGGNECWILGAKNASCDATCETIVNPADGSKLSCMANVDAGAGDWHADVGECNGLGITTIGSTSNQSLAPYVQGGECHKKTDPLQIVTCSLAGPLGPQDIQRICRCEF